MAIGFCPHCKHKINLKDTVKIGKHVRCWYCGAILNVTEPLGKRNRRSGRVPRS
ncbi:MAG: hypothetical protein ACFE9C_17225 [Candidatus Hodarchaeota archaeon]